MESSSAGMGMRSESPGRSGPRSTLGPAAAEVADGVVDEGGEALLAPPGALFDGEGKDEAVAAVAGVAEEARAFRAFDEDFGVVRRFDGKAIADVDVFQGDVAEDGVGFVPPDEGVVLEVAGRLQPFQGWQGPQEEVVAGGEALRLVLVEDDDVVGALAVELVLVVGVGFPVVGADEGVFAQGQAHQHGVEQGVACGDDQDAELARRRDDGVGGVVDHEGVIAGEAGLDHGLC
jgi:hypothetical protein